ncbi:membrane-spanning 4-domains subfamily A member 4D-like [Carcharodon carcharias]|uniref:membrane-spanning 4-domains subfamily A member 4D-like n=1 Tax=Carcharodon carcharias TaxID=13397 RepID=UPI001B7DF19F|nr:membrane-spanning 4-domains subfamily A member 4D-like [Carcharodon carcharias]
MAYLSKNDGNVLAPDQLPPPQPLANIPQLLQNMGNSPLNQSISTILNQNNSGVQAMLKGKLKALGITEIVTGIITMMIGIIQISIMSDQYVNNFSISIGTPWWTGVLFIIAGSLAVAVEKEPTHGMIRGCLSMNIISAIICLPAIIIYSVNLAIPAYCYDSYTCQTDGLVICLAILLLLTLLNAAISISVSSFNCKAMNCCCAKPVPIIIMYNTTSAQLIPTQQFQERPPPYNIATMGNVEVG